MSYLRLEGDDDSLAYSKAGFQLHTTIIKHAHLT